LQATISANFALNDSSVTWRIFCGGKNEFNFGESQEKLTNKFHETGRIDPKAIRWVAK
jgi:hypothetical protein